MAFKGLAGLILNNKQSRLVSLFIVVMIFLILVVGAVSINEKVYKVRYLNITLESASEIARINNIEFNENYRDEYMQVFNDFSDISYKRIRTGESASKVMKIGAKKDNIAGYQIGDKRYVIHLIDCDREANSCAFRVNGVPTKDIYNSKVEDSSKKKSFKLDSNHEIVIKSIQFNFCDNRRYCDVPFDAYHLVEVEVVER